jgi:hypothetical protein
MTRMAEPTMTLWRSPAGRYHWRQTCTGNGRPRETRRVRVTEEMWNAAAEAQKLCRCVMPWRGWRPKEARC